MVQTCTFSAINMCVTFWRIVYLNAKKTRESKMKLKKIALAISVAAYSAGAAYAATPLSAAQKLQPVKVTAEQIKQRQQAALSSQKNMMRNEGLNVHINRQYGKFVEEEGITGEHTYIVRLVDQPVAIVANDKSSAIAQEMQTKGINKLYSNGKTSVSAAQKYEQQLLATQRNVISEVQKVTGSNKVREQYTKALNGFSMTMTQEQAKQVASMGNVVNVQRSKFYDLLSDQGPIQIGADQVWIGAATVDQMKYKGEGQIIAVIDTGVNSDHPSFADIGDDGYNHVNPWGTGNYVGNCADDELKEFISCNDKLIGIRTYQSVTDIHKGFRADWPAIGEDYQGHGSHTASTAAGNVLHDVDFVKTQIADADGKADGDLVKADLFPVISGVAPHANIIAYQVCVGNNDENKQGCPGEALVSSIEDAITDGVDVINFSIGGQDKNVWADDVQLAFLSAREAGINVAAAAGNGGQSCGSQECMGGVDNSSPWLAQVAATTHDREIAIETSVEYNGFIDPALGSEVPPGIDHPVLGGSINTTELSGVVVWAKDYEDSSGSKDWNGYCVNSYPAGTFDFFKDGTAIPGAADGSTNVIVVCQRHYPTDAAANARTAKAENVQAGGADGFILFNADPTQGTVADSYVIPSVHFTSEQFHGKDFGWQHPDNTDGIADWIDSYDEMGHQITIKPTVVERRIDEENGDWLADFSSRGPSYRNIETLAPTLAAPGVDVYAAYSDENPYLTNSFGTDYIAISGTSMASPHVAGSMALIRQANPTWTAAEVQSALAMTADNVVQYHRLNDENDVVGKAEIYRAGAGRINVANAVQAGLIMDETAENFKAADPYNGGTPHKLNMPNLVDFSCSPECSWVRTVKATRDGTWTVSNEAVRSWAFDMNIQTDEQGITIEASPSTFTLKAGETQTIVIKASIAAAQGIWGNGEGELHSALVLTADDDNIPDSRWPMAFSYDAGELPTRVAATAHRDDSAYRVSGIRVPKADNPVGRVYAPVKAEVENVVLHKDDDITPPWMINTPDPEDITEFAIDEDATFTKLIEVPANTKRLVIETLGLTESEAKGTFEQGNVRLYMGKDYDGDGKIEPATEILCLSNSPSHDNFCNLNDPEPGTYWAILHNPNNQYGEFPLIPETFTLATAVISNDVASNMAAELPASDGTDTVDLDVNWNMAMSEGDIYYTAVDVGTSAANAGNLGTIGFKLTRGVNDVSMSSNQSAGKAGDNIAVSFNVLANNSGADRDFTITTTLPEGVVLTDSDLAKSNADAATLSVEGNILTISGTQPDTGAVVPHYNITTNATNEMCMAPDVGNPNPGGYINMSDFGINPLFGGLDENGNNTNVGFRWANTNVFETSVLFGGHADSFHLYNNKESLAPDVLKIGGNGAIMFDQRPMFWDFYFPLPFDGFPDEIVAPLWRAGNPLTNRESFNTELSWNSGVSMGFTGDGWAIIEWDNASDYAYAGQDWAAGKTLWDRRDNSFDFEVLINANVRHNDGEFELIMAYDNIDFGSTDGRGSIGIKGYSDKFDAYGPLTGYKGEQFALNNLDEVIKDDLIVCYDYVGPESSQFSVTLNFDVTNDFSGRELEFSAVSSIEGMADINMSKTIAINSNITLVDINDMSTDENTDFDINVTFIDDLNTANSVSVSGEAIASFTSVETASGATLTVTPKANYHGKSEVTVTVADIDVATDKATTSFMLTVNSDGIELGCTDSTATNFDSTANKDDGSCTFPAEEKKKSSGSFGWLMLAFVACFGLRRKAKLNG